MKLRNRNGTPVDPVPWFVTVALGFMVLFSFGPIYLREYGLSLRPALVVLSGTFVVLVGVTYWRYIYTARPEIRAEVPVEDRLERLFYAILVGILLVALASIPLATR